MADAPRTDEELLKLVGEERKRSIGFGEGDSGELRAAREKALAYSKGEMNDLPTLPNRSRAVDTAVADAIETVLPDVMEVFVGGEDVATFIPEGEQDEERAKEETDFVQHVVFTENEGFLVLYSAIKDSLLTRTGIIGWWWEEKEKDVALAQVPAEMAAIAQQVVEDQQGGEVEAQEREDGSVALSTKRLHGKVCIKAFPSEDFTIAADAVSIRDTTYCAVRDRPRVQDLIARGIDAEKARELPQYGGQRNGTVEQERDQAGETDIEASGHGDLRTVEVRDHYIRLLGENDKPEIWRVTTDSEETVLLDKEVVGQIPFAAFTPYIVPHRFYGESVADKLIQVQQLKTVVLRNHMDAIYFALNQRHYVDETKASEFTIPDLLANEPGRPVRGKGDGAVTPLYNGPPGVDTLATMEYVATMAEQRTGVVRNAQGLNPDTLHDTAKGALALITAAQKRVRMIARIFAETGVKDLFLGVHCLLRNGYAAEGKEYVSPSFKRGKDWKTMEPQRFPDRCAMTVHVGVGSAGREHDMMIATQRLELMERAAMLPGVAGRILDDKNLYQALLGWERATGTKAPELYWSSPEGMPPPEPKPDPEVAKAQGQLQIAQQKAASDVQLSREKAAADVQTTAQKHQLDAEAAERQAQRDHELKLSQITVEAELKRWQVEQELALKERQLVAELQLKRELGLAQAAVAHETGMAKVNASTSDVHPGGEAG